MQPTVIAAVIQFLQNLAAGSSGSPNSLAGTTVWLDDAPMRDEDNNPVNLPYIVAEDHGGQLTYVLESIPSEHADFRLVLRNTTLEAVGNMMLYVRWGGWPLDQRLGLDFATLSVSGFPEAIPMLKATPRSFKEPGRGKDAKIVYCCELMYTVYGTRLAIPVPVLES